MYEFKLTIRDILSRELFKFAKLVAGENGLDRQVKWSHVLEVKEFESLINGGELILTTGVGLQLDLPTQLKYVTRLIEKEAACICIELGPYFTEIPFEIIELANKYDFPIIVFNKTVKFVDITQDLHTMIINQHHQMLSQLDTLSRQFNALSLTHNGILKILQQLNHFFRQNVFFISEDSKPYYYPVESKELQSSVSAYIKRKPSSLFNEQQLISINQENFALMPVRGLGQVWGHLCLQVNSTLPDEFPFLILDRAALAIAQILLRNRTLEERKQKNEDEFVRNLLNGRDYESEDVQTYLPSSSTNMYFRVFVLRLESMERQIDEDDWEEIKLQRSMMIRSLFNRTGFFPAVSSGKNELSVIASFIATGSSKNETNHFEQVMERLRTIQDPGVLEGDLTTIGISSVYNDISDVKNGYEEAIKTVKLLTAGIIKTHFYEQLGIYQILLPMKKSGHLESFIGNHLNDLFDYDKKTDSSLFETLHVYLECGGSKKETAERLFIVRQTLYHRLAKLETLLGLDFMEPTKRLALEVAIKAYQLIKLTTNEADRSNRT